MAVIILYKIIIISQAGESESEKPRSGAMAVIILHKIITISQTGESESDSSTAVSTGASLRAMRGLWDRWQQCPQGRCPLTQATADAGTECCDALMVERPFNLCSTSHNQIFSFFPQG